MNIKVCGITQVKQVQQLEGLGIDFVGFIFDKHSPSNVEGKLEAKEIANAD
jgi:phosphoribosylanthranilate isomerase